MREIEEGQFGKVLLMKNQGDYYFSTWVEEAVLHWSASK